MKIILFSIFLFVTAPYVLAEAAGLEIDSHLGRHFRFVAYGDTRFTDPANITDTNPIIRQMIVRAIATEHPSFISFGGDIPMEGSKADDWKIYDQETSVWRENRIAVYPAMGNHEIKSNPAIGLDNFFAHFPALERNRFYSVRAGNTLLLTLDSNLDETEGEQGEWLRQQFKYISPNVKFVFISLHHPLVTSAGDKTNGRSGSSARPAEQKLAVFLEEQQKTMKARIVAFSSHVHNYERHERGGVTYFVTGGGGAHAYPISRLTDDPYQSTETNYHYLLLEVNGDKLTVTMKRIELVDGTAKWSTPDKVTITTSRH